MMASLKPVIEWLGTTPEEWSQVRLKEVFRDCSGSITMQQLASLDVQHYSIPNFDEFGAPALEDGATIASNKTLLRGGEILYSKLNCHKPRVWQVPDDEKIKVASTEFIPLSEWYPGSVSRAFFTYLLGSAVFAEYMTCFQTSVTNSHRRINPNDLWQTSTPFPPLPEQQRIAAYLDASCAAIDATVAAKRGQLETLDSLRKSIIQRAVTYGIGDHPKLRTVGKDWLKEAPAHWKVCRIKRVLAQMDYGIGVSTNEEGRYPVLKMGHVQEGEIRYSKLDFVDEVEDNLILETGDLLFNRTNSPDQVGKAAIFRKSRGDEITFASYLVRLRVNHRANPWFLNYVLNSEGFLSFARRLAIPSVQQSNLNSTRYAQIFIPLPPIDEQESIRVHLDDKTREIKRIVDTIESQITNLTAYRKSLIHECVTGQRRVTEADLKQVKGHG